MEVTTKMISGGLWIPQTYSPLGPVKRKGACSSLHLVSNKAVDQMCVEYCFQKVKFSFLSWQIQWYEHLIKPLFN